MTVIAWQDSAGVSQFIFVDATLSEKHQADAQITEDPVERGVATTDNVRAQARKLQLQVFVSDSYFEAGVLTVEKGRAERVYAQIEQFQREGTRITVTLGGVFGFGRTYENMAVASATTTRTSKERESLTIDLSLTEIRVVNSQIVPVPRAKEAKGQPKTNAGDQGTKGSEDDQHQSTLFKLLF